MVGAWKDVAVRFLGWLARLASGAAVSLSAVMYMVFVVPVDGMVDLRESVLGLGFLFGGAVYAVASTVRFLADLWRRRRGSGTPQRTDG